MGSRLLICWFFWGDDMKGKDEKMVGKKITGM